MSINSGCRVGSVVMAVVLAICSASALAEESDPRVKLAEQFAGVSVEDIKDSPIPGVYEVAVGAQVAYMTVDGKYLLRGDLYDLDTNENLTEGRRSEARAAAIRDLDTAEMIVFSPPKAVPVRHTVTVFTDIDCGYCRKFHDDIDQITARGVEVRYLFFPRTGPNQASWRKAEMVWCSDDRLAAMTDAKAGENVTSEPCGETPVAAHFGIGEQIGLRGTPGVFTDGGQYIGGYLAPDELLQTLDQLDSAQAAAN
jgi:thiol:disulfide interchange protein DsbC